MAVHDLTQLALSSGEDVVEALSECFKKQQYCLEVGDLLVTVNPWRPLETVDTEVVDFTRRYRSKNEYYTLLPHPCCLAEKAVRNTSDCAIIPVGESGSGKSYNIEVIWRYLALRSNAPQQKLAKETMLAVVEVLDLFCNAATLICNNSTRCLKFFEMFFDAKEQSVLGVNVKISLLDKMRVTRQIKGENNFNIFHRLLQGLSSVALQENFLNAKHRYVQSYQPEDAFYENDKSVFESLKCLETIGLTEAGIEDVLHLVSAIILLGDLQFGESSKRNVVAFRNGEVLEKAAMLLGVPCANLAPMIVTKSKTVRGQKVSIAASCSMALYECDHLAVLCYETLVMWLETRINLRCTGHARLQSDYSVVLLDVFGWENYNVCSFDQLCVNIVNEALHSTYNAIVFKSYQTEMEEEGIFLPETCDKFDQPGAVPFMFKPKGLLDVVHNNTEPESRTNDESLLKKLDNLFKKEPRYIQNNQQELSGFLIEHFIGEVTYDVRGFVSQSKNWLNNNVLTCLKASKNKVVASMAEERINRENSSLDKALSSPLNSKRLSMVEKDWLKTNVFTSNSGKDKKKIASVRNSNPAILTMTLTSVLNRISSSKVYFIRCLNSNIRMQPAFFDQERVLRQVRWSNLYAAVKTRFACLKCSYTFAQFIAKYRFLFFHLSRLVPPTPEACNLALGKNSDDSQYRVGKTKVYLSRYLVCELDKRLKKALIYVILVQKVFRGVIGRKRYQTLMNLKKKYDGQRSLFFSQITDGISTFHDHLSLQISEDQRRLKQTKLKEELAKNEANETNIENKQAVTSPGSQDRRTWYALGDEVITDETAESLVWCKVVCFQRTKQLALFSVMEPKVLIDGTNHIFTTDRIGFNSFPTPSHDAQMKKVKACIGRGVQLYLSNDGSLIAVRMCKNPIFVKGFFCEEKLVKSLGELSRNEESKVLDYRNFMEKINYECHPARVALDSEERCLTMCVVHLCFVKNSESDETAPCWSEIILTQAVQYVKDAISLSMQRRREVQEKYHFQQPPSLRIDSKMESTSAKILKLVRPSRYIETVRFKRKGWARKRVVSNPFLYGEDSSSEKDQSESPRTSCAGETVVESPEETSPDSVSEDQDIYENVQKAEGSSPRAEASWQALFDTSEEISQKVAVSPSLTGGAISQNVQATVHSMKEGFYSEVNKRPYNQHSDSVNTRENLPAINHLESKNDIVYENYRVKDVSSLQLEISSSEQDINHALSHPKQGQQRSQSPAVTNTVHGSSHVTVNPMPGVNFPRELHEESPYDMPSSNDENKDLYVNLAPKVGRNFEALVPQFSPPREMADGLNSGTEQSFLERRVYDMAIRQESVPSMIENFDQTPSYSSGIEDPMQLNVSDIPSPDYIDDDSFYTNLLERHQEELMKGTEEVYEVMNSTRISHEETYTEKDYVNYTRQ